MRVRNFSNLHTNQGLECTQSGAYCSLNGSKVVNNSRCVAVQVLSREGDHNRQQVAPQVRQKHHVFLAHIALFQVCHSET